MAKRLRDVCTCRKANTLARRTLINFIVSADVSQLKLPSRWNNERTYVRCYRLPKPVFVPLLDNCPKLMRFRRGRPLKERWLPAAERR